MTNPRARRHRRLLRQEKENERVREEVSLSNRRRAWRSFRPETHVRHLVVDPGTAVIATWDVGDLTPEAFLSLQGSDGMVAEVVVCSKTGHRTAYQITPFPVSFVPDRGVFLGELMEGDVVSVTLQNHNSESCVYVGWVSAALHGVVKKNEADVPSRRSQKRHLRTVREHLLRMPSIHLQIGRAR